MKKLLFSLVAAGACGGVIAAPAATADFSSYTVEAAFDVTKQDDGATEVSASKPGYWTIDTSSDQPEMTIKANGDDKYLQINTGSIPLWRTFAEVRNATTATSGKFPDNNEDNKADGDPADGVVVSSKVKLTACTEFPKLTDFPNEKLALFLFSPEEGDTTPEGLYAIGGEMTEGGLKAKAYKLDIDVKGLNVTNAQGWATVSIKTYGDIYKGVNTTTYPAFVIGINGSVVGVANDYYVTGFENAENLIPAATTRITGKTLIPAALPGDGTICGLGFQGEGGIDDVNLAASESEVSGMADAVTMTVNVDGATVVGFGDALVDGVLTFTSGGTLSFTLDDVANKLVTVTLGSQVLEANNDGVYTFTPAKDAVLTIVAKAKLFEIGGVAYGSFDETALAALAAGGRMTLSSDITLSGDMQILAFGEGTTITIDLNGKTISGSDEYVIVNQGATIEIVGNGTVGTGTAGSVLNSAGVLTLTGGAYEGLVTNVAGATLNLTKTAKFKVTTGLSEPDGLDWAADGDYFKLVDEVVEPDPEPSIPEGDGDVVVDETTGDATVKVDDNKKGDVVVTVPDGFNGAIAAVVPPTVTSISGVPADNITVKVGEVNITGAFTKTTDDSGKVTLDLNPNGAVEIDGEPITVEPQLVEDTTDEGTVVAPFEVPADGAEANVAAIPGLTYELVTRDDLNSNVFDPIVDSEGNSVEGAKMKATGKRVNLKDNRTGTKPAKRFYKVKVSIE